VHDAQLVDVLHPADYLFEDLTGLLLVHSLLFLDALEEFPLLHVLHDQEEVLGGLNNFVQLNDIGVSDELKDVDFPVDSFHIGNIDNFVFLQYLDGNFFTS
jgi:hypothetical protein